MKELTLELTNKCTNCCLYCSSCAEPNGHIFMPAEKAYEVIDSMHALHIHQLNISGGEPFLHPQITEIVCYAAGKNIQVSIYTSGVVTDQNGKLHPADTSRLPDTVKIMYDLPAADEAVYNRMMGSEGHLSYVKESMVLACHSAKFVGIHFVPTKLNLSQFPKILQIAREFKVKQVKVIALTIQGRAVKNYLTLMPSDAQIERFRDLLLSDDMDNLVSVGNSLLPGKCGTCTMSIGKLVICCNGEVHGCETFKAVHCLCTEGCEIYPDSIYRRKLENIYWDSEFLAEERKAAERYHDIGDACPMHAYYKQQSCHCQTR